MFFKNSKDLYAPISGKTYDITKCNDSTFSNKLLGDGFIVIPSNDIVCSPCKGIVESVFPTNHALCIKMKDGKDIMVHIGIDTVKLKGQKMESFVKKGDKVKPGTPLVKFDSDYMKEHNIDMSVIIVLLNYSKKNYTKENLNQNVTNGALILRFL